MSIALLVHRGMPWLLRSVLFFYFIPVSAIQSVPFQSRRVLGANAIVWPPRRREEMGRCPVRGNTLILCYTLPPFIIRLRFDSSCRVRASDRRSPSDVFPVSVPEHVLRDGSVIVVLGV
ncbi:hypothetical protein EYF80_029219 [Liparis tanakae]|uniref:Uncharacterized protein n=1 Tax=Liparis tanakae TaxID=230148 RepID=A0A4Z2H448_9TELE|nr:hypothetical protein EYF80_029219 [Liparis tanakae]